MIEVKLTPFILNRAENLVKHLQVETSRSMYSGEQNYRKNLIGAIGECVFEQIFKQAIRVNNYYYDFIIGDRKIDIKTKECAFKPLPEYAVSVLRYSINCAKCSHYVFVRVSKDLKYAWILGGLEKDSFRKMAKFYATGDIEDGTNFVFKQGTYNLPISKLNDLKGLLE